MAGDVIVTMRMNVHAFIVMGDAPEWTAEPQLGSVLI